MRALRAWYEALYALACRWHVRTYIGAQDGDTPNPLPYADPRYVACPGCHDGWCTGEDERGRWICCPDPALIDEHEDPQDAAEKLGPYEWVPAPFTGTPYDPGSELD